MLLMENSSWREWRNLSGSSLLIGINMGPINIIGQLQEIGCMAMEEFHLPMTFI
jgi:hypothetical protein